jgi:hypothetical protein
MGMSGILIVVLIIFLVATTISLIVISNLRPSVFKGLSPTYGNINETKIGSPSDVRDNFLSPSSGTLLVYLNYKTNNKSSSINNSTPIRILELNNCFKIELNAGNMKTPQNTSVKIQTRGENNSLVYETFPLKNLPEQKWVQVVIVKEGRRYTIYYNGEVVFSERTINFPTINAAQFIIGDKDLSGVFALPRISPTEYRINDVLSDLAATSDTRHKPYLPTDSVLPDFYKLIPSLGCPNGFFCFSTYTAPVQNPLKNWKTPYA